jgi:hypothetical protein
MDDIGNDQQRRRLKQRRRSWKQLRSPRVLKTVLWAGVVIYRVVRWMYEIWNKFSG